MRRTRKRSFRAAFGASVSRGVKRLRRSAPSLISTALALRSQTSQPLTGESDYKVDYKKRGRPRSRKGRRIARRRRKWRRNVRSVVWSTFPRNSVLRQSCTRVLTDLNASSAVCYQLYGADGTTSENLNPCSDLREFFRESMGATNWNNIINTASLSDSTAYDAKLVCSGANMETTVRNVGTVDAIVEVYQYRTKRDFINVPGTDGLGDPAAIYSYGFLKTHKIQVQQPGGTSVNSWDARISASDIGSTPFQSPTFTRHFTILKRTKYRIAAGSEMSFVHVDSKRRTFNASTVKDRSVLRGITSGFIFQCQGAPTVDLGVGVKAAQADLVFLNVRRYSVQFIPGIGAEGTSLETTDA